MAEYSSEWKVHHMLIVMWEHKKALIDAQPHVCRRRHHVKHLLQAYEGFEWQWSHVDKAQHHAGSHLLTCAITATV